MIVGEPQPVTLTTREAATAFWLAVALILFLWKGGDARRGIAEALKDFLSPKILVHLAAYAVWVIGIVWVGSRVDWWNPSMLKDTLLWSGPGLVLWASSVSASAESGFFRRRAQLALGLAFVVAYVVNLETFDVVLEIMLIQPFVVVLVIVSTLGEYNSTYLAWKRRADGALIVSGVSLLMYSVGVVVLNASMLDLAQEARNLMLPVWLTLGALPYVYALAVYVAYETVFSRIRIATTDGRVPLHAKLALVGTFKLRYESVHRFAGEAARDLALSKSLRDACDLIRVRQAALQAEQVATKQKADDLARYEGVEGTDAAGRRLDKREFEDTSANLEHLSVNQMIWYRHGDRYHPELLRRFEASFTRGLPEDHGITLRVKKNGQSWFAWRRTASGWCFAVGASGPPPDQWFYDGPEPPKGYPGANPTWGDGRSAPGPNWTGLEE